MLGRQNVGKSTLVNRLSDAANDRPRDARRHPRPGRGRVSWRGQPFTLVDTGGFAAAAGDRGARRGTGRPRGGRGRCRAPCLDAQTGPTEEDASGAAAAASDRPGPVGREQGRYRPGRVGRRRAPHAGVRRADPGVRAARTGSGRAPGPVARASARSAGDGEERRGAEIRARRQARTWASRRCSTGWWARSARWCSRRPGPPATRSTPWSSGRTGRFGSSTRPACVADQDAGRRVLQLRPGGAGDRPGERRAPGDRRPRRLHVGRQADRRPGHGGRRGLVVAANKWDLVEEKDPLFKAVEEVPLFAEARPPASAARRDRALTGSRRS